MGGTTNADNKCVKLRKTTSSECNQLCQRLLHDKHNLNVWEIQVFPAVNQIVIEES